MGTARAAALSKFPIVLRASIQVFLSLNWRRSSSDAVRINVRAEVVIEMTGTE